MNTPPRLKSCGFWANPSIEEFSAQGPVPSLERPGGRSWVSLLARSMFYAPPFVEQRLTSEMPKSRTGGTSNDRVGTLGAKPAVVDTRISKGCISIKDVARNPRAKAQGKRLTTATEVAWLAGGSSPQTVSARCASD